MRKVSRAVDYGIIDTVWVLRGLGDWYNYAHILRAARRCNFTPACSSAPDAPLSPRFVRGKR